MKKTTMIIMLLTIVSQALGFGREIVLSYYYGASNITDAYLIALLIPGLIIGIIASGISSAYIPVYNKIPNTGGLQNVFTSQVINLLLIISTVLLLISYLFLEEFIKLFAYGFDSKTIALTKNLTNITLLSIYFIVLIPVFTGFLQSNKIYTIPTLTGIPFNIIIIISIILSQYLNIFFLSYGFLIANILSLTLMGYFVKKQNFSYNFSLGLHNKHTKKVLILAIPVILGASFNQINILIDRTLASGIAEGGITSLHYASRITLSIDSIVTVSFMVMFFPLMSKLVREDKMDLSSQKAKNYLLWVSIIIIPISIFLILYSEDIITLLFGRGAFDDKDIIMTSEAMLCYSIGMVGVATNMILTKSCYALNNTSLPMKVLLIGIIINIVSSVILSKYLGIKGLALGTSVAAIFAALLLYYLMKKKYTFLFKNNSTLYLLLKIFLIATLTFYIGKEVIIYIEIKTLIIKLLASLSLSCLLYLFLIHKINIFNVIGLFKDFLGTNRS